MSKTHCTECGEELIAEEELEAGLCVVHLDARETEMEAELDAEMLRTVPSVSAYAQSLHVLRDWFMREEIELSTPVTLRFQNGHEEQVILCIWPTQNAENYERGPIAISLWFEHLAEQDKMGEAPILCPEGEWTLDKIAEAFRIDSNAPIWDVEEDI